MNARFLSHVFSNPLPVYGQPDGKIDILPLKSMASGDSCHTYQVTFNNHTGTHVDGPAHFIQGAARIADYPADFWIFSKPQVVEIAVKPDTLLNVEHLDGKLDQNTDALIIKTGFQKWRGEDQYSCHNPGVSSALGIWLRLHYPKIRLIGFDFISLSSFQNRPEGRLAHKAFLDPNTPGHPILIVEDMDLSADLKDLKQLVVAPLLVKDIDSAPCTVVGFFS